MKVLADRVAVIPIEDPDTTPSGLYIPGSAKQRCDQGVVKYIGKDVKSVSVGDHVLFSPYSGTHVSTDVDGLLFIFPESDIACMLEGLEERLFTFSVIANACAALDRGDGTIQSSDLLSHLQSETGRQF